MENYIENEFLLGAKNNSRRNISRNHPKKQNAHPLNSVNLATHLLRNSVRQDHL